MSSSHLIYDFNLGDTASFLEQLIAKQFQIKSRFEIKIVDCFDNNSNIYLRNGQIFIKQGDDVSRVRFYLRTYKKTFYNKPPRIHILDCETMQKYSNFSATNSYRNSFIDLNTRILYENQILAVCRNCINKLYQQLGMSLFGRDWNEIVLEFEENDATKITETRPDGYVINWSQISSSFRTLKQFTCERCHLHISNSEDFHFMQSHHKDYDKLNNKRTNLECLCVHCHSQVDGKHRANFSSIDNQILLKEFMNTYQNHF